MKHSPGCENNLPFNGLIAIYFISLFSGLQPWSHTWICSAMFGIFTTSSTLTFCAVHFRGMHGNDEWQPKQQAHVSPHVELCAVTRYFVDASPNDDMGGEHGWWTYIIMTGVQSAKADISAWISNYTHSPHENANTTQSTHPGSRWPVPSFNTLLSGSQDVTLS